MKTDKLPQIRRFESVLRVAEHYKCDNDKKISECGLGGTPPLSARSRRPVVTLSVSITLKVSLKRILSRLTKEGANLVNFHHRGCG